MIKRLSHGNFNISPQNGPWDIKIAITSNYIIYDYINMLAIFMN